MRCFTRRVDTLTMASTDAGREKSVSSNVTDEKPLRSIVETPLTDSLINGIFQLQNADGSFPADQQLGDLFNVNYDSIKEDLIKKGLDSSIQDEIFRLISTGSVLFYFLYHSQKTSFPVDLTAIEQFVSKARSELESFSMKDDPVMQTYIDKGELAVKYVIGTREKYADHCRALYSSESTWESLIQRWMALDQ